MRKNIYILLITMMLLMPMGLRAEQTACQICPLLDNVAATGAGSAVRPLNTYKDWACKAKYTADANPTALVVCLQGDPLGKEDFEDMLCITFTSAELTQKYAIRGAETQIGAQIRGNVLTVTGGTNFRLDFGCAGAK